MSSLLEKKLRALPYDYVSYDELHVLLQLTDDALQGQIKRALKKGYLTRLRKGSYHRSDYLEESKPHPFEMAHKILWPSYVSLESALSFHELIPEAVYSTTCVATQKTIGKRETAIIIENAFGYFNYHKIPTKNFFMGVTRYEENDRTFFIATPWKAIADYVFCYKKDWRDKKPLEESLRIDVNTLPSLDEKFARDLSFFYQSKRIDRFLKGVIRENK